jgi:hypothetical protein
MITGLAAGDRFGDAIVAIGDVNADRYSDIAVGASDVDVGGTQNAGEVTVYFGNGIFGVGPDGNVTGTEDSSFYEFSLGHGDVNGDGYADLIVGSPWRQVDTLMTAGLVEIYYGAPGVTMDETPDLTLAGEVAGHRFGWRVATR